MAWATSDRRKRLPADWPTIRDEVKRRAHNRCQATTHAPGCHGVGTDADHITPGDDHSLDNLQWLSSACHKAKTAQEAATRNRARARSRRRPEAHPGATNPTTEGVTP